MEPRTAEAPENILRSFDRSTPVAGHPSVEGVVVLLGFSHTSDIGLRPIEVQRIGVLNHKEDDQRKRADENERSIHRTHGPSIPEGER